MKFAVQNDPIYDNSYCLFATTLAVSYTLAHQTLQKSTLLALVWLPCGLL